MKRLTVILFFISLIVLSFSLFSFFLLKNPVSESSFPTSVTITETLTGFDVNATAVTFGSVTRGGSATRFLSVANDYEFPVRVESIVHGSIAPFVQSTPSLVVAPGTSLSVPISLSTNGTASLGNYTGLVTIALFRAS